MRKKSIILRKILNTEKAAGLVCTSPFIIGFVLFTIVPMTLSFYYSFCNFDILSAPEFVGMKNYKMMFFDATFYQALKVTFKFALISVPLRLIFALIVALLLLRTSRVTGFYRAIYYLPSIIGGSVAVSILWKRMFATDGVINSLISLFGVTQKNSWLGNENTALGVLIVLAIWQFGSSMLIFLASLKQIPSELYEASKVDGANQWSQFWKVTLPLLTPTMHFNLVMQMINGFLAFTQCFIITKGKPMDSTLFYTVYMYEQSFEFYNTGYGAALAWVMLIIISIITWILFVTKRFWVYDEGT